MWGYRIAKTTCRGTYTPEAAIVMTVVLFTLLACIMLAFNLYSECLSVIEEVTNSFEFDAVKVFYIFSQI